MGERNTRASLSQLHSEVEVLIWAMECMRNLRQYHVTFATIYGRYQDLKREFYTLRAHSYTPNEEYKGGQSCTQCYASTVVYHSYGCRDRSLVCKVLVEHVCVDSKKKKENYIKMLGELQNTNLFLNNISSSSHIMFSFLHMKTNLILNKKLKNSGLNFKL